jgi:PDDEXK-like uncharacterized protein DUF3799
VSARILNVSPDEYHRDPCPTPSLSASMAKLLLKSRKLAWLRHPKLGAIPRVASSSMTTGSLLNDMLLGMTHRIVVIDAPDFKTKAAREARDLALATNNLPVTTAAYGEAEATVAVIQRKLQERGISLSGQSEVAIAWEELASGGERAGEAVLCRGQLDHLILSEDSATIYDLKTTRSAEPDECAWSMVKYGYDIQHAAYTRAVAKLRPQLAGRVRMQFLFIELGETDPEEIMITPVEPSGAFKELGRAKWQRAVDRWAQCLKTGEWSEYVPNGQVAVVDPPARALAAELGESAE